MIENIVTAALAFIATNLDDVFILMIFYGNKSFTKPAIMIGQYLGIAALIAISVLVSLLEFFVDIRYIGLLGLYPIYIGLKQIYELWQRNESSDDNSSGFNAGILTVASVTIANGGDNIGVYVPLFSLLDRSPLIVTILIFLALTFVWCMLAEYLSAHPLLAVPIEKYGHIIMPLILVLLGIFILYTSESFSLVS